MVFLYNLFPEINTCYYFWNENKNKLYQHRVKLLYPESLSLIYTALTSSNCGMYFVKIAIIYTYLHDGVFIQFISRNKYLLLFLE